MLIENADIIVLDINFASGATSRKEGMNRLNSILQLDAKAHVITSTAYGDIELAVNAMKNGAVDFLIKPWEIKKSIFLIRQQRLFSGNLH